MMSHFCAAVTDDAPPAATPAPIVIQIPDEPDLGTVTTSARGRPIGATRNPPAKKDTWAS